MPKKKIETESLAIENAEPIEKTDSEESKEEKNEKPIEKKVEKPEKSITCQLCGKTMLKKTYKYYHSLKCLPPTRAQTPEKHEHHQPQAKESAHVVQFEFTRRVGDRGSKYTNLISKAF
jgi:hypothetical protein